MNSFTVLSDSTRRTIIEMLSRAGKLSAGDICDNFSISTPAVSQHLKVLRDAHFVHVERKAQQRIYSLNHQKIDELDRWIRTIKSHWESRLDRLENLLHRDLSKGGERHAR